MIAGLPEPVLKASWRGLGFRPTWRAETLKDDLVAGITVSLVAIPQSLAYAQLAGVPPYYGLYAALVPSVVGVLFGSSAQLSTGPVAMTSLLTAASVAPLALARDRPVHRVRRAARLDLRGLPARIRRDAAWA